MISLICSSARHRSHALSRSSTSSSELAFAANMPFEFRTFHPALPPPTALTRWLLRDGGSALCPIAIGSELRKSALFFDAE